MKVIDCTVSELFRLTDQQQADIITVGFVLKADSWNTPDMQLYEWGVVKEIQQSLTLDGLDAICEAVRIGKGFKDITEVYSKSWRQVFGYFNYLQHGLERIAKMEELLNYEPTSEEMRAGIEEFNKFGVFVTIDRLAGGDPLKYEAITKMPYNIIYSKLLLSKTDSEFQKRYEKIISDKYKH